MAASLAPVPVQRFYPLLPGGKVWTYESGTSTPLATCTDAGGGTAASNPIILDSNGQATIWLTDGLVYRVNILDADDAQQSGWPIDGIQSATSTAESLINGQNYGVDLGSANAVVIVESPVIATAVPGNVVYFKCGHTNTGATTINTGFGVVPLVNRAGGALVASGVTAGTMYSAIYDAAQTRYCMVGDTPIVPPNVTASGVTAAALLTALNSVGLLKSV